MATPKTSEIKVRVSDEIKAAIVQLADERLESESVIVREALIQYLAARRASTPPPTYPAASSRDLALNETPPVPKPEKKPADGRRAARQ